MDNNKNENYTEKSIKVLKGLEAVRKRPGMYIGNVEDGTGLHQMLFELIDNAIDEVLAGFCNTIIITIWENGFLSVHDNGRGIPVNIMSETKKTAAETVMTVLHSGSKFDNTTYKISGGLHGVGVSVVNALSSYLKLYVYRDGFIYKQEYEKGKPISPLECLKETKETGTNIIFYPDITIFNNIFFSTKIIKQRLLELSFLNKNIKLIFEKKSIYIKEEKNNNKDLLLEKNIFFSTEGLQEYLKLLCSKLFIIDNNYIYLQKEVSFGKLEVAFCWSTTYVEKIICYTNSIAQNAGGTHLNGLKSGITKAVLSYMNKNNLIKKDELIVTGESVREGLVAVLSLHVKDPSFSSQTKEKLVSVEVRTIVDYTIFTFLEDFLQENPAYARKLCNKIITATKAREAAKRIKDLVKKKVDSDFIELPRNLTDCQLKKPTDVELYLVEGDSAGGSVKQARDRKNQAVLPLKGKIINVEKAALDKVLLSSEVINLFSALGCGFGKNVFSVENLRYHTVIIMTDADVDGSHIRTLLLTFFLKYTPDLLLNGHIFVAKPPLFSVFVGKKIQYFNSFFCVKNFSLWFFYKKEFSFLSNISCFKLFREVVCKKLLNYYIFLENIFNNMYNTYDFYFLIFLYTNIYLTFTYKDIVCKLNMLDLLSKLDKFIFTTISNYCLHSYSLHEFFINKKSVWLPYFVYTKNGSFFECKITLHFFCSDLFLNLITLVDQIKIVYEVNTDFNTFLVLHNITFFSVINSVIEKINTRLKLQRYKGLGEMNPEQLCDTVMDFQKRTIQLVTIYNIKDSFFVFDMLLGDDIKTRKIFIENNASNVAYSEF